MKKILEKKYIKLLFSTHVGMGHKGRGRTRVCVCLILVSPLSKETNAQLLRARRYPRGTLNPFARISQTVSARYYCGHKIFI